jgi:hypothetical protein
VKPLNASTDGTIALLNDVAEFLEGQADVRDGSDGPRPNKAMELMARAEIEIERLKRDSRRGPSHKPWTHPMTVTETMMAAAKKAEPKVGRDAILHIYRAMMAASPSATSEQ